jgi:type IV pilus assembly protein PilE
MPFPCRIYRSRYFQAQGFTLIEAITVVAIIGIIAGIAWSVYDREAQTARRKDGISALTMASHAMELCKADNGSYTNCTLQLAPANSPYGFYTYDTSGVYQSLSSPNGSFKITQPSVTSDAYTLTATNNNPQDTECTTLTLDNLGRKSSTPVNPSWDYHRCWGE